MKWMLLVFVAMIFAGCDPPPPTINLPTSTFNFTVTPSDSVIHVGDTITFSATVGNQLGNIKVTDGSTSMSMHIYGSNHIPKTIDTDVHDCYNGQDYVLTSYSGVPVFLGAKPGLSMLSSYQSQVQNDSFKMKFQLVLLKMGLYQMSLEGGELTSNKGLGGVVGYFNVLDHHWDFLQMPGSYPPAPGTDNYKRQYIFAVE